MRAGITARVMGDKMSERLKQGVKFVVTNNYTKGWATGLGTELAKGVHDTGGNLVGGVLDLVSADEEGEGLDNPLFEQNGHDGKSPKTAAYFAIKKQAKMAGTMGIAYFDVGGIASGLEGANSGLVWYRLNALYEAMVPPSRRAKKAEHNRTGWFTWELARKEVKAGSLEIQMGQIIRQKMMSTGGSVFKSAVTFGTGGLTGYFVNALGGSIGVGINALFGPDIPGLAMAIHWFAFVEHTISHGRGKGPASRILDVVWEQFALGKGSGVALYDVVKEPRGWLVIADLLS
jgi:hypothetical protein